MKPERKTLPAAGVFKIPQPGAVSSLRVAVTLRNRDLLRRLRAAELSAWEQARFAAPSPLQKDPPHAAKRAPASSEEKS